MAGAWLLTTQFAAAGLMLLLAAWLLKLDMGNRVHRAFALFLALRAAVIVANRAGDVTSDPNDNEMFASVASYYLIALAPATLYFISVYPEPRGPFASRIGAWVLVVATGALEALYMWDHCLFSCAEGGASATGPLGVLITLGPAAAGIAAWVLAGDARGRPGDPARDSFMVMSAAFLVDAATAGGIFLALLVQSPANLVAAYQPWPILPVAGFFAAACLSLATVLSFLRMARRSPQDRLASRRVALLAVAAALVASSVSIAPPDFRLAALAALGLARLAPPLMIGYALLRLRLFEVDVRIRWTLSKAALGSVFLACFFIVSEATAAFLGERFGTYLGIAATGVLLFFAAPLQSLSERLILTSLGTPRSPLRLSLEDRLALYRDQAREAWKDGSFAPHERAYLDALRARLELAADDALRVESDVAAQLEVPHGVTPQ